MNASSESIFSKFHQIGLDSCHSYFLNLFLIIKLISKLCNLCPTVSLAGLRGSFTYHLGLEVWKLRKQKKKPYYKITKFSGTLLKLSNWYALKR